MEKIDRLMEPLLVRHRELEWLMSDPSFHQNPSYRACAREHNAILARIGKARELKKLSGEVQHLVEMIRSGEQELSDMARTEKEELLKKCAAVEAELMKMLLPRDPNDEKNVVLEIRAGTGGDEA